MAVSSAAPSGRGAVSDASGRFEAQAREAFDDGWTGEDAEAGQLDRVLLVDWPGARKIRHT